jgi:hypothetical protein
MNATCPNCGQPASGRFCSACGTSLVAPAECGECGAALPEGGRFCTACGAAAGGAPLTGASATEPRGEGEGPRSFLPWAIAAGALVALLAMVLFPRFQAGGEADAVRPTPPITGPVAGPQGQVDLASMSPREAGDRLFNRVMQSVETGDTAQAIQFLPMAINAYEQVADLDLDGHYHVAVLHLVAGNAEAARARADTILAREPNHLFGLVTAAQAEMAMGNERTARSFYARFLDHYETEVQRDLTEYRDHQAVLPAMRKEAQQATGAR